MDEISTPLTEQDDHPLLHDPDILSFPAKRLPPLRRGMNGGA